MATSQSQKQTNATDDRERQRYQSEEDKYGAQVLSSVLINLL